MAYSDYIIYADESGDEALDKINSKYPVFVLNFCIFEKSHYNTCVVPQIQDFKFHHFGHDNIILHERTIRKQQGCFEGMQRQPGFMNGLTQLMQNVEISIVATVIHKPHLKVQYISPWDPYELAMLFCMEGAHEFLKERGQHTKTTYIIVERRRNKADAKLKDCFDRICASGYSIQRYPMPHFRLQLADKQVNSSGLQLADLTARPIGLHVIRPTQANRSWDIIKDNIYRNRGGTWRDDRLKVFPY